MMKLDNKVAIVTGAGTGIGKGIVQAFVKEGTKVMICGRRRKPLEETVQKLTKDGFSAAFCEVDITSPEQIQAVVDRTIETFGDVDILVNNAGVFTTTSFDATDESDWDRVINIDLKGTFLFSKKVLPHMLAKKYGKIVNIASIAGMVAFGNATAYCSAKAGVIGLTRTMALDYASKGVSINAIAPGVIMSDMTKELLENDAATKAMIEKIPVGRIGTPEDIANAAVFLASDQSSFIVGQTIAVDGGWTIV